jgi:hypothetical protein
MPIDLTAIISVIMGVSIVLIPVIGLTARFALKPTVEALARVFEGRGRDEALQILERRISLLEQQLEAVETSVGRLEEAPRFDAQLRGGPGGRTLGLPETATQRESGEDPLPETP